MPDLEQASRNFMLAADRLSTLYSLSEEYIQLVDLLEDPKVDPHLIEQELDRLSDQIAVKADKLSGLIRWLEGLADLRRAEIDRLKTGASTLDNRAAQCRAYLLQHMQATGMTRIDTARFTLTVKQNPPRVEVLEPMLVPSEYQRTKITIEPDKTAIREHYKQTGEVVPGVEIVRGERLDIR